jgi:hypothetical protein
MTTSSSATSPCSSPTPPGPGWSICLLRKSPTGTTWSRHSLETSRARTCTLGTPGISEAAASSQGNPCESTTCRDLVSKLGRKTPTKASELMDIATKIASGQEAIEAIFRKDKQPQGRQQEDVPEASAQRGMKKKVKKKAQAKRDAADANLVAAVKHRNPRKPPGGANLFDKMLKESCPYHQGPVRHTLEECVMLRRYFHKVGPPSEGGKGQGNDKKEGDKEEEFPEVHGCFMIYGGRVANASARHRKQERREVCSVKVAAPIYLDWSDKSITFDQGDHPDCVSSLGRYPLVVDPVVGNARLTKVIMDGGSSLNIIYAETLGLLEIDLSTIRTGAAPFSRDRPRKACPVPWAARFARLFRDSLQLPQRNPHVRGGRVPRDLPRGAGETVLRQVHGRPQLHYLKLKMSGPNGVITVGSTHRHAYECDVECVEYAEAPRRVRGPHRRPEKPLQGGA